jgi:protein-tyrosine phosphatase
VIFAGADEILSQLLDAGMLPIVTHPERNSTLQRKLDDLARWSEMGCYVQVTAGSILGGFGRAPRSSSFEMLDRRLVHFIRSGSGIRSGDRGSTTVPRTGTLASFSASR